MTDSPCKLTALADLIAADPDICNMRRVRVLRSPIQVPTPGAFSKIKRKPSEPVRTVMVRPVDTRTADPERAYHFVLGAAYRFPNEETTIIGMFVDPDTDAICIDVVDAAQERAVAA